MAAVEGDPNRDKADVHLWEKTADRNKQQWRLEKTNAVVNNKIDQARNVLNKKQAELTQAQNELQKLKQKLSKFELKQNQIEQEIKDLAARLQTVIEQLQAVQAELNRLNNEFLKQVKNIQQSPQSMPELATDSRGLVTKGALLGFVRPLSRINAIETSEGNVQLSYFDTQGRMRQTNYDATSDSRNAAFEQWIPDSVRACPNFDKSKSVVLIEDPIALNEEWTIEAWFSYPLPETAAWNTLTRGKEKDHHIIVKEGKQLGTFIGSFQDSGYNMEHLSPGWHHIAAVGRGEGEQGTTTFYIDGRQVGECQAKTTSDVYAIANYQAGGQQFGKVAEVRIWQIALSAEEIAVNSKTLLSGNEPGLLGYYPMNEAQGTEVRDHSENNRHGKMQSTTWFACTALIGHPGHTVMQFDGENDCLETAGNVLVAAAELKARGTFHLTQTLTKTERRSKGFALNVELRTGFRGLESTGITDADDRPILPGEKVNRYRLKSFYLEGGVQHFHDFFNYVVDPEWLISNSEEARALRQTKAGKANKTWRVLHRVTYVERPALMGFGQDIRQLPTATTAPDNTLLLAKIQKLERNNQELEQKIDQILKLLQSQQ